MLSTYPSWKELTGNRTTVTLVTRTKTYSLYVRTDLVLSLILKSQQSCCRASSHVWFLSFLSHSPDLTASSQKTHKQSVHIHSFSFAACYCCLYHAIPLSFSSISILCCFLMNLRVILPHPHLPLTVLLTGSVLETQ